MSRAASKPGSAGPSRRGRWAIVLALAVTVAVLALVAGDDSDDPLDAAGFAGKPTEDSYTARWIDSSALNTRGFGQVEFEARDGNDLTAKIYRSSSFDPSSGPIWFVMHGASRNAERYIRTAAPVAERYGALTIVIHFSREEYPRGGDYTLGVTSTGWGGLTLFGRESWREPQDYLYAEIEHVFEAVRRSLGGHQRGYYLFGHSAGAQFTHRLLTFLPGPRVLGATAANAGWYTLPDAEDPRYHTMPYGLNRTPLEPRELRGFFETPFVVLLGERDTSTSATDRQVRGTPEAQAQGATRLDRGKFYFAAGEAQAKALSAEFAWRLAIVPRAGHAAGEMIDSAGFLTFVPDEPPCVASDAAQAAALVITEILADPPRGEAGDANADGERDPADDEFVEIVNAGKTPVCLSGWALGDAKQAERHVFPLGRALAPGHTLVVFGGGVPTGPFGGAEVQWASKGLSLSNAGDVITLRDVGDAIVHQVSWGDFVRRPEPGEAWKEHVGIDGSPFSPGVIADRTNQPS